MFCNKYNKYNVEFNFFFQEVKILKGDKFIKKKEKEKPVISEKGTERKKKKKPCGYHKWLIYLFLKALEEQFRAFHKLEYKVAFLRKKIASLWTPSCL